jgi:hypothetical protein
MDKIISRLEEIDRELINIKMKLRNLSLLHEVLTPVTPNIDLSELTRYELTQTTTQVYKIELTLSGIISEIK